MKERGKFSVLLSESLLNHPYVNIYTGKEKSLLSNVSHGYVKECLNLLNNSKLEYSTVFKHIVGEEILNIIGKLSHANDYENLATLLDLAFKRDYYHYCKLFFGPSHNNAIEQEFICSDSKINPLILNNMVFVVDNKDLLINAIKKKGYIISEGPQKRRGHLNSISNFLSYLDNDYRNCLFNHYCYHYHNNLLPEYANIYPLDERHFYFSNIHKKSDDIIW